MILSRRLNRLSITLILLAPWITRADDPPKTPPPPESRAEAISECGGPPIRDGHDVQPTPAHDKCLADKEGVTEWDQPPKTPAKSPAKPKG